MLVSINAVALHHARLLLGLVTAIYLPPDTSKLVPPNPSQTGWYSIYLPRRDGRLSSPRWLVIIHPGYSKKYPLKYFVHFLAIARNYQVRFRKLFKVQNHDVVSQKIQ